MSLTMATNPLAPVLKLSQKAINNRGVVSADLALAGAFTVSGPAGGTIYIYFDRQDKQSSEDVDVLIRIPSGAAKVIKLTKEQVQKLGNQKIGVVAVYVNDKGDVAETSDFIDFTLDTKSTNASGVPISTPTNQGKPNGKIRIDWYGTSTNLADGLQLNLRMMEGALNSSNQFLDIYAFWDQSSQNSYPTGGGKQAPWPSVGTALLKQNPTRQDPCVRPGLNRNPQVETETLATSFEIRSELDTGSKDSFRTFLASAVNNSSAIYNNKVLILSGHGGGIMGGTNPDGPDHDDAPASGYTISSAQLTEALSSLPSGFRYDLVGFDECLMGSVEVAYKLKPVAKYLVASQESIAGNGWDYYTSLSGLQQGTAAPVLGKRFVDAFRAGYGDTPIIGESNTLALTDLGQMDTVVQKISTFVTSVIAEKSPQFWSAIAKSLLSGTYYGGDDFGYYQDLAGFVARVALLSKASSQTKSAANALLDALGKAVLQNTIKSNNQPLIARSGMKPVARGSYGLSVVLPYNYSSYKNLLGEDPISMREFVSGSYQEQAGEFLSKSGWGKLLVALDDNKCFLNEQSPFRFNAGEQVRSVTTKQRYSSADKLKFYLSTFDYIYNVTGNRWDNAAVNSLGVLNNYLTGAAAKVKLENLTIEIDPTIAGVSGSPASVYIDLWDEKSNKILATFEKKADSLISLNLAKELPPALRTLVVLPTLKLRVSTNSEDGVAFATQIQLNGNKLALPSAGFDAASPIKLPGEESYAAAQILDPLNPERYFSFVSDRSPSPVSVELNSVTQASDLVLAITENPGAKNATTILRDGLSYLVQTFIPKPATKYLIHVYKKNKNQLSNDFAISKEPPTDHDLLNSLTPSLLSLNHDFARQGEILMQKTASHESSRFANFFVDEAALGVRFYAYSTSPNQSILLSSVTSAAAPNALSRASVFEFNDETPFDELLTVLNSAYGKTIGKGASTKVDLSTLPASFALSCAVGQTSPKIYRSTDASVISTDADEDTSIIFGNGTQVSLDSGVYQLPKDLTSYELSFVAASGRQPASQSASKVIDTLFFYKVDSITGALFEKGRWIKPGDTDYSKIALSRSVSRGWSVPLDAASGIDTSKLIDCSQVAMGLVVNGSVKDSLQKNQANRVQANQPYALFSVPAANSSGTSSLISLGNGCYSFESGIVGSGSVGSTNDFADLMVRFDGRPLD